MRIQNRRSCHHLRRAARWLCAALALAAACAAGQPHPPAARASASQLSLMMEDNLLLYGFDAERVEALRMMKAFGVDAVRVTVLWSVIARNARSTPERAAQFDAADPSTYPHETWDRYDRLVEEAAQEGIGLYFTVTGPGPTWAHRPTSDVLSRPAWKPRADEFEKFVHALGRRYSGSYNDDNDDHRVLPRVGYWAIWNEPNQPASLTPQSEYDAELREWVPTAPILYRDLYWAATRALRDTGHGSDLIFMGETAPLGKDVPGPRKQLRPRLFVRELFCVRGDGEPYTGAEAAARRCGALRRHEPFQASAWAHHPYTQKNPPWHHDPSPDSVNMSNVGDLAAVLDQVAQITGLIEPGLPIVLSEIGWRTNPPNPYEGIALARQSEYINVADHLAYSNPRVVAQTQFLLKDVGPRTEFAEGSRAYWYTWQSGVLYDDARPKPSLRAYLMPLDVTPLGRPGDAGRRIAVWGQLRPPNRAEQPTVSLQFRPAGQASWEPLGAPIAITNPRGFYVGARTVPEPGRVRAVWRRAGPPIPGLAEGRALISRAVAVRF